MALMLCSLSSIITPVVVVASSSWPFSNLLRRPPIKVGLEPYLSFLTTNTSRCIGTKP